MLKASTGVADHYTMKMWRDISTHSTDRDYIVGVAERYDAKYGEQLELLCPELKKGPRF